MTVGERKKTRIPRPLRGMSARLLVLTIFFVMLSEVLIYVPSVSRFRLVYLQERIEAAHLASLALKARPDYMVADELRHELLVNAKLRSVMAKRRDTRTLVLSEDMPPSVDAVFDLRDTSPMTLIGDAFEVLRLGEGRTIRVIDSFPDGTQGDLEVLLDEGPLYRAMVAYSTNILQLSIVISLLTAGLVFLALHILMVRPMRRLTESMVAFRKAPESEKSLIGKSRRGDEIGTAQRELNHMQEEVRSALRQRAHLAALGAAVSKINHDLRNMLATAQLVTDGLSKVEDPAVRRVAPRLMRTIDRAISLCTRTLNYGKAEESPPRYGHFVLTELIEEVREALGVGRDGPIDWRVDVPAGLEVRADREQIFRVLMNLGRNAVDAMAGVGMLEFTASHENGVTCIDVRDDGPGLPESAREHLFEAFAGSVRKGGTGLGLAIARELVEGHGGTLALRDSNSSGTCFRVEIPDSEA
jgi:signal transduction histidine kinase